MRLGNTGLEDGAPVVGGVVRGLRDEHPRTTRRRSSHPQGVARRIGAVLPDEDPVDRARTGRRGTRPARPPPGPVRRCCRRAIVGAWRPAPPPDGGDPGGSARTSPSGRCSVLPSTSVIVAPSPLVHVPGVLGQEVVQVQALPPAAPAITRSALACSRRCGGGCRRRPASRSDCAIPSPRSSATRRWYQRLAGPTGKRARRPLGAPPLAGVGSPGRLWRGGSVAERGRGDGGPGLAETLRARRPRHAPRGGGRAGGATWSDWPHTPRSSGPWPSRPRSRGRPQVDYFTAIKLCERNRALRDVVCSPRARPTGRGGVGGGAGPLALRPVVRETAGRRLHHVAPGPGLPADRHERRDRGGPGRSGPQLGEPHRAARRGRRPALRRRLAPVRPARSHRAWRSGAPGVRDTATVHGCDLSITDYGAFSAGDATLHAGYTVHGSRNNPSGRTRYGVAVVYVPDGARVAEPADELQEQAIDLHIPGRRAGDIIDTAANPVLWPAEAA